MLLQPAGHLEQQALDLVLHKPEVVVHMQVVAGASNKCDHSANGEGQEKNEWLHYLGALLGSEQHVLNYEF